MSGYIPDQSGSSDLSANVRTDKPNIYGPYNQTFPAGRLEVRNPANTFGQLLQASASITASRTITFPASDADDVLVSRASADTLLTKTFGDFVVFLEVAAPSSPAADTVRLYAKDKAGTTELFYKNSAGTERDLSSGGGGGGGASAMDDLSDVTLSSVADGEILVYDGGSSQWVNSATLPVHDLLSADHGDTTADTVVRGDIVTGQGGSPTWTRLAIGASGEYVRSDGTDVAWAVIDTGDLPADVIKNSQNNDFGAHHFDMESIAAPADPSADEGRFYVKQIDGDNDGFFVKLKKATAFVEVQIA